MPTATQTQNPQTQNSRRYLVREYRGERPCIDPSVLRQLDLKLVKRYRTSDVQLMLPLERV